MKKLFVGLIIFLNLICSIAFGATLNLRATWTPNTESNVALYKLYRTDGDRTLIGGATHPTSSLDFSVTVDDNSAGTLNFVVTAVDTEGEETADSQAGSFSYNLIPPLPPLAPPSGLKIEEIAATNGGGTNYYVEPKGSLELDATDEGAVAWAAATNILTPTSGRTAFARAVAGDIVYFRDGTYQCGSNVSGSVRPYWAYPDNSGTSGNPITFMAYPSETPIMNGNVDAPKVTGYATAGTNDNTLVDSTKDFLGADAVVTMVDVVRTLNTTKGGAFVQGTTNATTLDLTHASHNRMDGFTEGDWYEIGRDSTIVMGTGDDSTIRNYIIFDGFTIQANDGTELGLVRLDGDSSTKSVGNIIRNCIFEGPSVKKICHGDNRPLIRLEDQDYVQVKGCMLRNNRNAWDGLDLSTYDTNGIQVYTTINLTIENNEFYNLPAGTFLKYGSSDVIFRYNYLHDNKSALLINFTSYDADRIQIYHNVFANVSEAAGSYSASFIGYVAANDLRHGDDNSIYNNTFYNSGRNTVGFHPNNSGYGWKFYNNIVINNLYSYQWYLFGTGIAGDDTWTTHLAELDHNQFGSPFKSIWIKKPGTDSFYTSLATWQASTELESAVDVGCGSNQNPGCGDLSSDPLFVNSSGNMNILADFALQAGSPCKGAGRGGVDMGADISLVGVL